MSGHAEAPPPQEGTEITVIADQADAGKRADRFLAETAAPLSRARIQALIEAGCLTRDGAPVREPAEKVRAGARYRLLLPAPAPARPVAQPIPFPVLYEDAHIIVLDKPAGLVVHPAPGNQDGTLVNALLAYCGEDFAGIGGERRPGIVHRLDKDTSGVMVVAKTAPAHVRLTEMFAAHDLTRAYLALCWGVPGSGELDGAIGRDPRERKRMAVVARGGKAARTRVRTLRSFQGAVALVECRLETGRTHQIRVHLAHAGHPVVGDPVYLRRTPAAARGLAAPLRQRLLDFPRQALHAADLGFNHPISGEALRFHADPPADFRALLEALEGSAQD